MSKSNKPYRFTVLYSFEDREEGERKEKEVLSDFNLLPKKSPSFRWGGGVGDEFV